MDIFAAILTMALARHAGDGATAPADAPRTPPAYELKVPPGYAWDLFAWEPLVADPVAIAIDEQGRVFMAESERQEKGIEDNRTRSWWLFDDLGNETTADRLRMYEKWAKKFDGGMAHFTKHADRVRVLVDPGADGRPTRAVNFSGDMREPLDGTGAGIIARNGDVWYTCIPSLWRFKDLDGDGVADERDRVQDGFGIRIALRGHDMHGLAFGPDGRLYWSIGDRGYHLTLPDGRVLADPKSGAVFRCEPDGSNLEIFCTGLRNPQELAFNRLGDLFTGDNNSDAGDKARIVYCMEGGETGWDMNYQTLEGANQRGPWNQERIWSLWDPSDRVRPAWTLPPLAHVSSGPSGLVFYPGVGFDETYRDHFFMCDFLGDDKPSRILAFKAEPDGAGYSISNVHPFVTEVLPTDVDFDYAGRMVISDWSNGWESDGTGQIFRVWDPRFVDAPEVKEVTALMRGGFSALEDGMLAQLLAHPDMRVRLRAQWELAERFPRSTKIFAPVARGEVEAAALAGFAAGQSIPLEARLHAIWGLGQQARSTQRALRAREISESDLPVDPGALLVALLDDEDPEIRTQAARALAEAAYAPALEPLISLATAEEPRVRAAAAGALGRLGKADAIPALVAILWENEDQDPFLRHAASLALARIGDRAKLLELAADQFPQVRLGAVLALRRLKDPALERSLFDPDRRVATEAARAIHDLPIPEARSALVAVAERWAVPGAAPGEPAAESNLDAIPLLRRAIDECVREGSGRAAAALLGIAANPDVPTAMRLEALEAIRVFADPVASRAVPPDGAMARSDPPVMRDRVNGHLRPVDLASRDVAGLGAALATRLPALASDAPDEVRTLARTIAQERGVALDAGAALATLRNPDASPQERALCLAQLARQKHDELPALIDLALASDAPRLRIAAREALAGHDPARAVVVLGTALERGTLAERQAAITELAALDRTDADAMLISAMEAQGAAPAAESEKVLMLDLFEAAKARGAPLASALAQWRGRRPLEGTALYLDLALEGGDAERGRELLNYHSAAACLRCHAHGGHGGDASPKLDGVGTRLSRAEILRSLVDPNAAIAEGYTAPSAMPDMTKLLTPREVRDLVEYLTTLK